jgi:hypothetical protein
MEVGTWNLGRWSAPLEKSHWEKEVRAAWDDDGEAYEDQLVVLPDAAKSVRSAVAAEFIERNCGYEGRVPLAASHHPLLPRRK